MTLRHILASISLFSFLLLSGQNKSISIAKSPYNSDTSKYYKDIKYLIDIYKLTDLKQSSYKFHLRLWTADQFIEIYYNDTNNLTGFVTHYTVSKPDTQKPSKYYSKKIQLKNTLTTRLISLTDAFGILKMPSDENIDCWYTVGEYKMIVCKDGLTYFIEFSNPDIYSFKNYNCPDTRSCDLKIKFKNYIDSVNKYTDSQTEHLKFLKKLPKGNYYNGGTGVYSNY